MLELLGQQSGAIIHVERQATREPLRSLLGEQPVVIATLRHVISLSYPFRNEVCSRLPSVACQHIVCHLSHSGFGKVPRNTRQYASARRRQGAHERVRLYTRRLLHNTLCMGMNTKFALPSPKILGRVSRGAEVL